MSSLHHRASRSSLVFVSVAIASLAIACSGTSTSSGSPDGGPTNSTSGSKLGGSSKVTSCKNTGLNHARTAADDACDACDGAKCSAEGDAALGSDPSAFGGACGEFIQCTCDCDAEDTACASACLPKRTETCKSALAAALACEKAKCSSECAKDGG